MSDPIINRNAPRNDQQAMRAAQAAMRLSLLFGVAMLIGKVTAYFLTHSVAVFSDAAESVIHVIAVGFASLSLRLSTRPASGHFLYGLERISFFSAGFEGALIVIAAIAILFESTREWMAGLTVQRPGFGLILILLAGIANALLGYYLIRVGRRTNSLILEADGKHVLADSWTSFGVVAGLGLVLLTHWRPFDPLVAIAIAVNILWSGGRLVWKSAIGLLDYSDPAEGLEESPRASRRNLRGAESSVPRRALPHHGLKAACSNSSFVPARDLDQRSSRTGHHSRGTASLGIGNSFGSDYTP